MFLSHVPLAKASHMIKWTMGQRSTFQEPHLLEGPAGNMAADGDV